ncbi:MAG: hypothetical protein COX19_10195 [Desulfobacterales bacterium CG23_combo_of_CG06-09_8_20_14_all_51_8]|nr:MAG: hypothetical protein COX19_10195 [Desulfobacterales bacterium CG23_combo_of_CG06-09_8_20_14_all_51_8]
MVFYKIFLILGTRTDGKGKAGAQNRAYQIFLWNFSRCQNTHAVVIIKKNSGGSPEMETARAALRD